MSDHELPSPDAAQAGEITLAEEGQPGPVGAPEATVPSQPPRPKVVRKVVCIYRLGWLPGDWLRTWRRLDRVLAGANLNVIAALASLDDLPEDADILIVPPELREATRETARPGTSMLVTPASAAEGAFKDLVARLQAGAEFTAEKVHPI